jgi:hypothetical protein
MTPDIVKKLYREFHSGPVQGTDSAEASSHWKDFSKYSKVEADADGNIITIKGFGFGGSDDSRLAAKIVAATGNKLMMAGLSYPGLEKDVKKITTARWFHGTVFFAGCVQAGMHQIFSREKNCGTKDAG